MQPGDTIKVKSVNSPEMLLTEITDAKTVVGGYFDAGLVWRLQRFQTQFIEVVRSAPVIEGTDNG